MTLSIPYIAVLTCHPDTRSEAVHGIQGRVARMPDGALTLTYVLKGDISRLRIPPPRSRRWADRLWQHTCFEAFVSLKDDPEYYEFNFAPSGEWAAYNFRRYREGAPLEDKDLTPTIVVRSSGETFELDTLMPFDRLPRIAPCSRLRIGLSAVIEDNDGKLSYWALKHPSGKPDFHHPAGFALEIDPVDMEAAKQLKMENR
jgi:hypothetical protein